MRVSAVALACALLVVTTGCRGGTRSGTLGAAAVAAEGKPAPDWTEPTSTGGSLSLDSLRGKAVYLNFFATWCPPCNAEAPEINALQKKYRDKGLAVVGVDELESAKKAEAFRNKYGLVYPAIVDNGTLQNQYNVNGLPVHVFISRKGAIEKIVVGEMSHPQIESAIQAIL